MSAPSSFHTPLGTTPVTQGGDLQSPPSVGVGKHRGSPVAAAVGHLSNPAQRVLQGQGDTPEFESPPLAPGAYGQEIVIEQRRAGDYIDDPAVEEVETEILQLRLQLAMRKAEKAKKQRSA